MNNIAEQCLLDRAIDAVNDWDGGCDDARGEAHNPRSFE